MNPLWFAEQTMDSFCGIAAIKQCKEHKLPIIAVLRTRVDFFSDYVRYFHDDRTHLGLEKDTPYHRPPAKWSQECRILSLLRLGGLHHRYDVAA